MFQGLAPNVALQTASFYGGVTLGGTVSGGLNNLGDTVQVKYLLSEGKVQLIKTGSNAKTITFNFSELDTANSGDGLAVFQRGQVTIPLSSTTLPEEVFELHVPSISNVPLSYTRFGTYADLNIGLFSQSINPLSVFVFGQPTASRPTSGSATYTSDVYGAVALLDSTNTAFYTLGDGNGSATFSANFAANTINTLISLDADGKDFGDLTGTGTIVAASPAFSGTLTGAATGGFTGAFFGPDAVEMGYVFNAKGTNEGKTFVTYGNVFGVVAPPPP